MAASQQDGWGGGGEKGTKWGETETAQTTNVAIWLNSDIFNLTPTSRYTKLRQLERDTWPGRNVVFRSPTAPKVSRCGSFFLGRSGAA